MDPYGFQSTGSQAPSPRVPSDSPDRLSHHIPSFADFSQFEPLDAHQSAVALQHTSSSREDDGAQHTGASLPSTYDSQPRIRGQESLVSLDTLVYDDAFGAYTRTSSDTAAAPPTTPPTTYTALTASPDALASASATSYLSDGVGTTTSTLKPNLGRRLSSMLSSRKGGSRLGGRPYSVLQEEGQDDGFHESMGMASLAQKPSGSSKAYSRIDEDDITEVVDVPIDLTSFSGPLTRHDEEFLKELHTQEASGKLTLGLGAGFGPSTRLKESDLFGAASATSAASPIGGPTSSLVRSLSRRWSSLSPAPSMSPQQSTPDASLPFARRGVLRKNTVKALAQNEANRRGEIVEVIVEEEEENATKNGGRDNMIGNNGGSTVDLSVVSGAGSFAVADRRRSGIPRATTQVYYPQPNWRPFSMRWPYLISMIFLSVGLGVTQEVIYRVSRDKDGLVRFTSPSSIPAGSYFAIKFAPTLIAVTFGILWQVTDFEVKRLEAFYQLSKEDGAVADESINVDYVTYIAFLRPFRALYCKHYAVAVSSVLSLLAVSLVPTLSAASIVLVPSQKERMEHQDNLKRIMVNAVWSRILTAVFFVIAALGLLLFWLLHRRHSGLLSDVKGIAGLASLAVVSHIMTDFRGMDTFSHKEIHSHLKAHRYILRNSSLAPDDDNPVSLAERERYDKYSDRTSENPHPLMLRAVGCVPYICGIVLYTVFVPIVLFTPANVLADKAPWVLTALAVSIKLGWGGLETSVRVMEPYYILWKRHAPAKTLTLDYTAMPFVLVAVQALKNGHMLLFFVGFATILTELLTVLVTSLATVEGSQFLKKNGDFRSGSGNDSGSGNGSGSGDSESGEETVTSFWVTLGLVLFILAYMSIVATVVFVRRRRPFLPRQPNTIASVLAYIHQSKMLWNFVGTSKLSNKKMLQKLEAAGHTYGLGWFKGRDGMTHCGVDQEELLSDYTFRLDYSKSNTPWQE